ncbi:MAG TPA: tRNA (cytidine(34)-2'-O)-methyltransferase [Fimbriiglobus sp.]|jgi:tRNA (cytidine/uridine-2'-O-)-methyltransferase
MLHIALWEPEIPPNTGNVARLCAATGVTLHLIGRLGFRLDDKTLKRAGLDYWPHVALQRHASIDEFLIGLDRGHPDRIPHSAETVAKRIWLVDNPAPLNYTQASFQNGDTLLFGSESKGLPPGLKAQYAERLIGIPMPSGVVRSLNLSTAVGVVLYEALRQIHEW